MPRAFTLTEMLIVLVILGALTLVAVQSLQPIAEQARYETTRTTLQRIEEAVMGPDPMRQADGTPIISGFTADVGRLPTSDGTLPAGSELIELWDASLWGMFPYMTRQGPADFDGEDFSHIRLACGWRGPYVQPTSAAHGLCDGWGKPLAYLWEPAPTPAANVHGALSLAANLAHELPAVDDLPRTLAQVTVAVNVNYADQTPAKTEGEITVDVYLIHPDSANPGELSVVPFPEEDGNFTLHAVAPGLRAVRVIVKKNEAKIADKVVYRHVLRSGLSHVHLQLDVEAPQTEPQNGEGGDA